MPLEQAKNATKALTEITEYQKDLFMLMRCTRLRTAETKKLWRAGNQSRLIRIGMALIIFPDPSPTTEVVGACFVAVGAVKKGIQNRSIFMEDIGKTFQSTFKEMVSAKRSLPRFRDGA